MTFWEFDNWLIEQARSLPVPMNKGDNSKAQEAISNQIAQQQLNMQQNLMNMVSPTIKNIIAGGGMLPGQEATMNAIALNTTAQNYNNLYGKLGQELTARGVTGGQMAGGGDIARQFGALGAQEAGTATQALEGVQTAKMQGLESALGMGGGFGMQYGNQGISANSTAQGAAKAADDASTGFWGSLFGALTAPFSFTKAL